MKKEFLINLGIEKNIIVKIMAENGKDVEREKAKAVNISEKLSIAYKKISAYEKKMSEIKRFSICMEKLQKELDSLEVNTQYADEKVSHISKKQDIVVKETNEKGVHMVISIN